MWRQRLTGQRLEFTVTSQGSPGATRTFLNITTLSRFLHKSSCKLLSKYQLTCAKNVFYNYLHKWIETLILHSKTVTTACKTLDFPVRPFINGSCGKLKPDWTSCVQAAADAWVARIWGKISGLSLGLSILTLINVTRYHNTHLSSCRNSHTYLWLGCNNMSEARSEESQMDNE